MLYLDQLEGKSQTLTQITKQGVELTLITTFKIDCYRNKSACTLTVVLVSAGIELIFFLVAGIVLFRIQYEKNVDNMLMFSVVAK